MLVLAASFALAAGSAAQASRLLDAGPVLVGRRVAWGELEDATSTVRLDNRVVFRTAGGVQALAASKALIGFVESVPGCPSTPGRACPTLAETVVGPPSGSLRPVFPRVPCWLATVESSLDIDDRVVAYEQPLCSTDRIRIAIRTFPAGRPRVLATLPVASVCCGGVRVAGRFVAWVGRFGKQLVVYDLSRKRLAYRLRVPAPATSFDVQADGTVAVAYAGTLAWAAPSRRLSALDSGVDGAHVRIAAGRIAYVRGGKLRIVDLSGGRTTVGAASGSFDFDGEDATWASTHVTSSRLDCPPPGQGRPCVRRGTGETTIWTRRLTSAPRVVARLPFIDAILPG